MKKTYIVPSAEASAFRSASLCTESYKLDDSTPVGGGSALTRRQIWADEEEQ